MGGPCQPYITGEQISGFPNVCAVPASEDGPDFAGIAAAASEVIYVLTGMQFPGTCRATVRPVRRHHDRSAMTLLGTARGPVLGCGNDAIPLHNPVFVDDDANSITVKIDGDTFTDFYVRDGYKLVRSDDRPWPSRNRLSLADTEEGTFSITYSFGTPAPDAVKRAALTLAVEYAREDMRDPRTRLPPGTRSASRDGMSVGLDTEVDRIRTAGSAIPEIAAIMGTFNPTNNRMPTMIYSPDHEWDLAVVS
jgi:hypothetical protein